MSQFQVKKANFQNSRIVNLEEENTGQLEDQEILVQVEKFAYTSNNITYAVVGELMGYWKFFPPIEGNSKEWGIIPVWGFGVVTHSNNEDIKIGERLYGYFPPASNLRLKPARISETSFLDSSAHRIKLPSGYNLYRRVNHEEGYNTTMDNGRMLLWPLHVTSYCLWDALQDKEWYGAQQIIVLSASSKTSIGLGIALQEDKNAPKSIGLTSTRNLESIQSLSLYDAEYTYDDLSKVDFSMPTVIVDMSGNVEVLTKLYESLGENMKYCINVGITHWDEAANKNELLETRSEFFFAPGHIQRRISEWGFKEFDRKSTDFIKVSTQRMSKWLSYQEVDGLDGLKDIHRDVCNGLIPADKGLIVVL